MNPAKIRLSPTEKEIVTNADLILTKNTILKKAEQFLAGLQIQQEELVLLCKGRLPGIVAGSSPKISRGENYKGLPYLVLDYPRVFDRENIYAVRTMFWWGNFFSITLHLSGTWKKEAEKKIGASFETLKKKNFYYYVHEDQWGHHFDDRLYVPLKKMAKDKFEESIREKPFLKLANKISLQHWDEAPGLLLGYFREIIEMLADQPPKR